MGAGQRDRKIVFERNAPAFDGYGGEVENWSTLETAWADVRYGTGQERREAAKESASVTATFQVLATSGTRSLTAVDRINFNGIWDIVSAVPNGRAFIDVTAIRQGA
jgi:SPP1 family predicted phage head-tail adaptor